MRSSISHPRGSSSGQEVVRGLRKSRSAGDDLQGSFPFQSAAFRSTNVI